MSADDTPERLPERSAEEAALARVYRNAATETPPPALDARIRAHARDAIGLSRTRGVRRWAIPLAAAATVVLSIGVVLELSRQGLFRTEHEIAVGTQTLPSTADRKLAESPAVASNRPPPRDRSDLKAAAAPAPAQTPMAEERQKADARVFALQKKAPAEPATAATAREDTRHADVISVRISGAPGAYQLSVTVRSPDTGCARYADWWEIVDAEGRLRYRRVLLHSHAGEQPFERSGGPVPIAPDEKVWVRAHMNPGGYGGVALQGSVRSGFSPASPPPAFAAGLANQPPLPDGCAF